MGKDSGFIIWFTGLPASGKTTIARTLQAMLAAKNIPTLILDSDHLRTILTPEPNYSPRERDWFYKVIGDLAIWLSHSGLNIIIAATAHKRIYRERVREQAVSFVEVYVRCDLATCVERDPKGIYALARQGKAANVPGIGTEYEESARPEITVDTAHQSAAEAANHILNQLNNLLKLG